MAGYKGDTGDCVTRAIAIATGKPYQEVYEALFKSINEHRKTGRGKVANYLRQSKRGASGTTPRNGVNRKIYEKYLKSIGWKWVAVMGIGTGCRMHVKESELPSDRLILRLSKHLTSTIDGVLHDTYDCSRDGTRAVYGYFIKES